MEGELNSPIAEKTRGKKRARRRGPRLTGVSRQRRMANARERSRVQNLNAHIERLRDLIPLFPGEKKPSKTETIRLAAVYISCLTDILEEAAPEGLERISSEDLMPTFPGFEDSLTLAAGIPPSLSLPKFLFEPFCDEDNLLDLDLGEYIWEEYE
ncbi:neurogenin-1-like [Montipora capricornis]|uniref:neurogenin-1-like n=1 Tax=Montipora foliosa TaxID=591990 RepID=UPI0035F1EBD8